MNKPLEKAFDHFQTAEHLFHTTLPIAKEPKLLPGIVKSISNSLEYALASILHQEKTPVPQGLLKKINAVRPLAAKYHLSTDDITFMLRIQEILHQQKHSPVEFKRGNDHIICSDDYVLEVISIKDVENFLTQTKKILNLLNQS
ncbi:MAG: hypothetical protein Q8R47_03360 [Nanoarchaeota archaeon]|nr:hypothetical protein [Nanoarchaeota archaeon]